MIGTGASARAVHPARRRGGGAPRRLPAHAGLDHAARRPGDPAGSSAGCCAASPPSSALLRNVIYYVAELLVVGLVIEPRMLDGLEWVAREQARARGPDPELRAQADADVPHRLQAHHLQRRLPAGARAAATSTSSPTPIAEIDATGIRTADGDAPRRSTRSSSAPASRSGTRRWPHRVVGRDGRDARRGVGRRPGRRPTSARSSHGFPNLFFLIGPNTGLGNNSMINIIEGQLVFLHRRAARDERAGADAIDVHRAVQDRYNARIQEKMAGTVWTDGRLQLLVPASTGRTARCGRRSRTRSSGASRASTSRTSASTRR